MHLANNSQEQKERINKILIDLTAHVRYIKILRGFLHEKTRTGASFIPG